MGDEFFKNSFRPLLPDVKILELNNLSDLKQISSKTAAVIIEPVQGEAGVRKADNEFLKLLRDECDANCALLIFDEIQTGFGRTGSLFAFEQTNVCARYFIDRQRHGRWLANWRVCFFQ